MGYFQVRYYSRVVNYERRGFIRLPTGVDVINYAMLKLSTFIGCSKSHADV